MMKNKDTKVGIITYWWSKENYGQILQMYALQKYLNNLGYNAFLIKYDPRKDTTLIKKKSSFYYLLKLFNPKAIHHFIRQKITTIKREKERINYPRFFDEFLKKNIAETDRIYSSINELRKDPPKADIYVTGSDVVWSLFRPAYYLDFGSPNTKRIAYAPSFGRDAVSENECRQIEPLLKRFNLITVRESQGVEICAKAGRKDAKLVLDPTLLLQREHYLKIVKTVTKTESFCFLYLLGSETKFSMKQIFKASSTRNLKIVYSTCEKFDRFTKVYPTINEWLGYYSKAEIIITNSYHGCIFAIIFNKDFIFLPLKGIHSKLNVRVNSLLSELNLMNRICDNNLQEIFDEKIDYSEVNKILEMKVEEITKLLKRLHIK